MITEQDKQAILSGEHGVTSEGLKVIYLGKSDDSAYPYWFGLLNKDDLIFQVTTCNEDLQELDGFADAITGLWENKPKPFNLDKALEGNPVKLKNGRKAYVKYVMPSEYKGKYPLRGYVFDPDFATDAESTSWTLDGLNALSTRPHPSDIIGMWEEPTSGG